MSAFGSWRSGADTVPVLIPKVMAAAAPLLASPVGDRDHTRAAGLRERAQPRIPASTARPGRRGRLLGLARRDARRGRAPDAGAGQARYATSTGSCAAAGYTAVGEFHYLGAAEARRRAAAEQAGIAFVLLHVAYARGGLLRMRQESVAAYLGELEALRADGMRVGVAPHSVRACPSDWLEAIGRYADAERCRCMSTRTSSRARSTNASPSTAAGRSSCSHERAA